MLRNLTLICILGLVMAASGQALAADLNTPDVEFTVDEGLFDGQLDYVSFLDELLAMQDPSQPAPTTPTRPADTTRRAPAPLSGLAALRQRLLASRGPTRRFASTPAMFGDIFGSSTIEADSGVDFVTADLPLAGGSRRVKIGEHNKAIPLDRIALIYNHFQNALELRRAPAIGLDPLVFEPFSVDRYTLAWEKTFGHGGCWSAELRMPFSGRYESLAADYELRGGKVGNLAVILKRLVYETPTSAVAVGLGFDTPTGSGVTGRLPLLGTDFEVLNESLHLLPYIGFLCSPNDSLFYHGFAQLDIAANGNTVVARNAGDLETGILTEQNLLYLDVSAGYWLCRNPSATQLTGLAALVEFHYTTTLQDADFVAFTVPGIPAFGNVRNNYDVVNLTLGLHAELANNLKVRVGSVIPLNDGDNRFFDSEVTVALIRNH